MQEEIKLKRCDGTVTSAEQYQSLPTAQKWSWSHAVGVASWTKKFQQNWKNRILYHCFSHLLLRSRVRKRKRMPKSLISTKFVSSPPPPKYTYWSDAVVKTLAASAGDIEYEGSVPGSGRSPAGGNGNPLHSSCLESHRHRSLVGSSLWGGKESDTTEHACTCVHTPSTEEPARSRQHFATVHERLCSRFSCVSYSHF